ncbi:hypothetical protein K353_03379 [Kitasatospora sp. SolWspMP-SS2h]|nr:hypothetical protein K353_03379 [Kitasatospora sp. SolWspMP-SS2h]
MVAAGTPVHLSGEHNAFAWRTRQQWEPFLQPEQQARFSSLRAAHRAGRTEVLVDGRGAGAAPVPSPMRPES